MQNFAVIAITFLRRTLQYETQRHDSSGTQFPPSLDNGRSPHGYINQRLQIQFGAPDYERCAARNMLSLQ